MGSQKGGHDLGTKQQTQRVFRPHLCLFHLHPTSLQESLPAPSFSACRGFKPYQLLPTCRNPHPGSSFYPPRRLIHLLFPILRKPSSRRPSSYPALSRKSRHMGVTTLSISSWCGSRITHLNGGPTFWGEVQFGGVGLSQMGTLQGHQASLAAEVTIEEASLVVQGLSDSVVKNPPARQETQV